jgi:flagella basal body P-ring formation protein FlgA
MRSFSKLLAAPGAALVLVAASSAGTGRVVVARDATVPASTIRLGDIATLEGDAQALADVSLGTSPVTGDARALDGNSVLAALRRAGADLDAISYTIPATVRVRRASQEIGEAPVREAVERFLDETVRAEGGDAVLRSVEVAGVVRIPAGPYTTRVTAPAGAPLVGRTRLQVDFLVDGRPEKTLWVGVEIGVWADVVVLKRPLAHGETIAADDLALDRRDLAQVPRGSLTDLGEATGQVARVPLAAFAPIRREQLANPAAVKRGDAVLLVATHGALRLSVPGEVLQDAAVGEQVRVVNRTTRKDLVGRVADPSTVIVEF